MEGDDDKNTRIGFGSDYCEYPVVHESDPCRHVPVPSDMEERIADFEARFAKRSVGGKREREVRVPLQQRQQDNVEVKG